MRGFTLKVQPKRKAFSSTFYNETKTQILRASWIRTKSHCRRRPTPGCPACFHVTCFSVLQSHFFFCVLCLWGWPDSLESARSPVVLLSGAVVKLFKKWAKKKEVKWNMAKANYSPQTNMLTLTVIKLILMASCSCTQWSFPRNVKWSVGVKIKKQLKAMGM